MAKLNATVNNGLEEIKLKKTEPIKEKKGKKENKQKKENKNSNYLTQVMDEMRKVTWPTRKNLVKLSIATILMIVGLSLFFVAISAIFDLVYSLVQGWIG